MTTFELFVSLVTLHDLLELPHSKCKISLSSNAIILISLLFFFF